LAKIFAALEKSVYNLRTNKEEIIRASFHLPLYESRGLMMIVPGQDGGPRRQLRQRYMSDQQIAHPAVVQQSVVGSPANTSMTNGPMTNGSMTVSPLDPVSLKWRSLIERRRAHFIELYLTGRWKKYYEEEQFLTIFRETMTIADRWNEIAPKPVDGELQAS
jgi:hypothetical protein